MNRYFLYLCFDGSRYHGWQIQPNGITVQEEIEKGLSVLLRNKTEIVGAGRTDAGVHAHMMTAHFDTEHDIDEKALCYKLNRFLPGEISIKKIEKVDNDLHARFSATSRTYHYYVHTGKDPFARAYSWATGYSLDFARMNVAAQTLIRTADFAAFCKNGSDVKTTICTITEARWNEIGEGRWYFRITANRFLRNMVRAIVGTLIEVGRGRMSIRQFESVVSSMKRTNAGESMPANALFLEDVRY
ncbi:MAG: tRNA pseudouridine(38-40) synthase TruA [Prevotella sp.]|uniref:tRNA pseudouridine(38-40) synthase TruA n=1 Tax=Prevotella sp. TaxID=59823 RepID=UPI002A2B892D|nr:tRNA pseudouridine(38-40) synthase TruA [Prevotella sp.]MDD7318064.1 tRNA pseudouridine(38-40) synthase TruA [Prevotellaceae bacterium]MDY4021047.1 tRNA pseudouridine(38-40) synthase TruA [Prevotella sp.]